MTIRILAIAAAAVVTAWPSARLAAAGDAADYRQWVEAMKEAPRGPFSRLRWFCNDGTVLPPAAYACRGHGGGFQHGEWSDRTQELRREGYRIANVLAGLDAAAYTADPDLDDAWAQLLIERYLLGADDGWIFRRAQFYRGAVQQEDERAGARALLRALAREPRWLEQRYAALRTGARLLPHGPETASAQRIRQESAALEDLDPGFARLRAKIHGSPEAADAERVRAYAAGVRDADLRERYTVLAAEIDRLYAGAPFAGTLAKAATQVGTPALAELLTREAGTLHNDATPLARYRVAARVLAEIRDRLPAVGDAAERLALLDLSLRAEEETFSSGTELREQAVTLTRAERLSILQSAVDAAYGTGLFKKREQAAQQQALGRLGNDTMPLDDYLAVLNQLGRGPGWGTQNLRFLFFDAMKRLAVIEPKALLFIQDQLRGSPLLLYSQLLDGLSRDANRIAGVRHRVFGTDIGTGLKALNPGLAIGVLRTHSDMGALGDLDPDGIYLLPETVSDLPPIAGILTGGEGNPLSHVQLLARNLGIPNVSVDESVLGELEPHDGERIVLAVSAGGLVRIDAAGELEAALEPEQTSGSVVIRPEPGKLRLDVRGFLPLHELRASDSGVLVGPKAAKLGELKHAFPDAVTAGVAIPFGLFKAEVLDKPYRGGLTSVYDWMVGEYDRLARLPPAERAAETAEFRESLYRTVLETEPSVAFRDALRQAMLDTFGSLDAGVFVRSDTNVEDLPGFTGAGLNLTLPNVVGYDALLEAIARVWASPFTERAFAWRQSHMETPQHVYTSILLLRSVASEKSGVMVTQDLDTGARSVLSVAVNEGLGGAVDGQAAESLRIDTADGSVRLLATATAPWRRRPAAAGGIETLPASGADTVLTPDEIERLVVFARDELPARFPPIIDDDGKPTAADIEFGFVGGKLQLFQLRPFLQSRGAAGNRYLVDMDRALASAASKTVDLNAVPRG